MIAIFAACATLIQTPTMVRNWTQILGDQTKILGHDKGIAYFANSRSMGAIREKDGSIVWRKKVAGYLPSVQLGKVGFVVVEDNDDEQTARIFDRAGGRELAKRLLVGQSTAIATEGEEVFVEMAAGSIDVFDLKLKSKRSIKISAKPISRMSDDILVTKDTILTGVSDQAFLAFDRKTGKKLWESKDKYAALYPILSGSGLVLLRGENEQVRDLRTGKPVWTPQELEWACLAGELLLTEERDSVVGRDWKTGRELWRLPGGEEGSRMGESQAVFVPSSNQFLVDGKKKMVISTKGKLLGTFTSEFPDYVSTSFWLCCDGERVMGYTPGPALTVPADEARKKALALRLVKDYEVLDESERDLLIPLARYAVKPLMDRYVVWAAEKEKIEKEKGEAEFGGRSSFLYGILDRMGRRLVNMITKDDTDVLLDTIAKVESSWWKDRLLIPLLIEKGDVAKATPFFVRQLRSQKNAERGDTSIDVIAKSTHPDAVKFLLDALADPKAPESWRYAAYSHLAGTGGDAGAAAVKAASPKKEPLSTWQSRIDFTKMRKGSILKEAKDAKGRSLVLFTSAVLGNGSDVFIAERKDSGIIDPVFIGLFTGKVWDKEPPKEFRGTPVKQFIETEWIKILPEDAEIRRDKDSDGLTDLVEARLGTDAEKADSDGDGMRDNVDPCPNAAPRELGDREKIVAAALAARFYGEDWGTPAVISVDKVEPFELYGYARPLLWVTARKDSPLGGMYGGGVNTIGFHTVREARDADWVDFSDGGKTARTIISRYSGGLNGDGIEVVLKKIGDDWFVVDLIERYVS